ncbi:DUF2336 domain-containing protein [Micromonospora sonneratiae]
MSSLQDLKCPGLDRERRVRALLGMAVNASTPQDVLLCLACDRRAAGAMALSRAGFPEGVAEALLSLGDREVTRNLAHNAATPVPIRWQLARDRDPDTRAAAAQGNITNGLGIPGATVPLNLLRELAGDPNPEVRARVAGNRFVPDEVRVWLAHDPDPQVREAVAGSRWQIPEPVYRRLLTDPDPTVRVKAISSWNPPPPADLHPALLADPATRREALPYVTLTAEQATALVAELINRLHRDQVPDADLAMVGTLVNHPDIPRAILEPLLDSPDPFARGMARSTMILRRDTPEPMRARLHAEFLGPNPDDKADLDDQQLDERWVAFEMGRLRLATAWMERWPLDWLKRAPVAERATYVDSPYPCFRRAVAAVGDLPEELEQRLLHDTDAEVRRIVVRRNHVLPEAAVERVIVECGNNHKIIPRLEDHPSLTVRAFERFAMAPEVRLRRIATHHRDLPPVLVARLAADPDASVRRGAAKHRNLPVALLPALLTDDDLDVVEAVGGNPGMPVTWMRELVATVPAPAPVQPVRPA